MKPKPRPPLKTISELALEFGVTQRQLSALMLHGADAPKPIFKTKTATWYLPADVRNWWTTFTSDKEVRTKFVTKAT